MRPDLPPPSRAGPRLPVLGYVSGNLPFKVDIFMRQWQKGSRSGDELTIVDCPSNIVILECSRKSIRYVRPVAEGLCLLLGGGGGGARRVV